MLNSPLLKWATITVSLQLAYIDACVLQNLIGVGLSADERAPSVKSASLEVVVLIARRAE